MKSSYLALLLVVIYSLLTPTVAAQESYDLHQIIHGTSKQYSLYFPKDFKAKQESKLVVAFHPFNVERWNAKSWRDTLMQFADMNNVMLLCPDGGEDGKVDDSTTLVLTDYMIDLLRSDYKIDEDHIYALGFSWGGKTVYSYAMRHPEIFDGYIPIGAALHGIMDVQGIESADGFKIYAIHGDKDALGRRFTTIYHHLSGKGAIYNAKVLEGVGHTIDFKNRNEILTEALQWLIVYNESGEIPSNENSKFQVTPKVVKKGSNVTVELSSGLKPKKFIVRDIAGTEMLSWKQQGNLPFSKTSPIETDAMRPGAYIVEVVTNAGSHYQKFWVK